MIFSPHIIIGAAIGAKTQNLGLIIILGLLSHFILDKIPHWDYSIKGIKNFRETKNFKTLIINLIKIAVDGLIGLLIIFLILWQKKLLDFSHLPFILLGVFISILPDILWGLSGFINSNFLDAFTKLHDRIHFQKQKEGTITFLGFFTQIVLILIAMSFFFF